MCDWLAHPSKAFLQTCEAMARVVVMRELVNGKKSLTGRLLSPQERAVVFTDKEKEAERRYSESDAFLSAFLEPQMQAIAGLVIDEIDALLRLVAWGGVPLVGLVDFSGSNCTLLHWLRMHADWLPLPVIALFERARRDLPMPPPPL